MPPLVDSHFTAESAPEPGEPRPPKRACAGGQETSRRLYEEGKIKYEAQEYAACADLFLQSFLACENSGNTLNASFCLAEVGRWDEALHLQKLMLTRFESEILPENLKQIGNSLADLAAKVATFELRSEHEGFTVEVDGALRPFPLEGHVLHLLPGRRNLVFRKVGFQPHEVTVDAVAGARGVLKLSLKPDGAWVRIEAAGAEARVVQVFVDGKPMGSAPWEGPLTPEEHLIQLEGEELGSAPRRVKPAFGATTPVRLPVGKLAERVTLSVQPASATLRLGQTLLGKGTWTGRLPIGDYPLRIEEEGYQSTAEVLSITNDAARNDLRRELVREAAHPRWREVHDMWQLGVGPLFGDTLASPAETSCTSGWTCTQRLPVLGGWLSARLAHHLTSLPLVRWPLFFTAEVGYLVAATRVERKLEVPIDENNPYLGTFQLTDVATQHGPLIAAGLGATYLTTPRFRFAAQLMAGAHLAFSQDTVSGTVTWGSKSSEVVLQSANPGDSYLRALRPSEPYFALVLLPELAVAWRLSPFELGFSLRAAFFINGDPTTRPLYALSPNADITLSGVSAAGNGPRQGVAYHLPHPLIVPQIFVTFPTF